MKHNICKFVKCPYYLHEDVQVVYCEGWHEGMVIHVAFANGTTAKQHKLKVCRDKWQTCKIANFLERMENDDDRG